LDIGGRRKTINECDEGLTALSFICGLELDWIDGMGERAVLYAFEGRIDGRIHGYALRSILHVWHGSGMTGKEEI